MTAGDTHEKPNPLVQVVSDATITASVKGRLIQSEHIEALQVNVDTDNGRVTLKGEVPSASAKDLAEQLAENTDGVRSVNNRLQWRRPIDTDRRHRVPRRPVPAGAANRQQMSASGSHRSLCRCSRTEQPDKNLWCGKELPAQSHIGMQIAVCVVKSP